MVEGGGAGGGKPINEGMSLTKPWVAIWTLLDTYSVLSVEVLAQRPEIHSKWENKPRCCYHTDTRRGYGFVRDRIQIAPGSHSIMSMIVGGRKIRERARR